MKVLVTGGAGQVAQTLITGADPTLDLSFVAMDIGETVTPPLCVVQQPAPVRTRAPGCPGDKVCLSVGAHARVCVTVCVWAGPGVCVCVRVCVCAWGENG